MSQVIVEKVHEDGEKSRSLFMRIGDLAERVRQRAFQIFQNRGSRDGNDLEDWLQAERELIWAPEADLVEKDGRFELQVAVPDFDAKEVRVAALPDSLVVSAESIHRHEKAGGDVCFCEFGERSLFRRIDLPAAINIDKVTANLDKGVLKLTAEKAQSGKRVTVAA